MRALEKDREARYQSAREMQGAIEEYVRHERVPVSDIALTQFMQSLFEDKLASQKEALLQGKQLADIIELQRGPESQNDLDASNRQSSSSVHSTPAASHTVTDGEANRRRTGVVAAIGAAIGLLAASVG